MIRISVGFLIVCWLSLSCTPGPRYRGPVKTNTRRSVQQTVIGKASYYGSKYHGRKTANGETFDMYKLTAAHRTYRFNTKLQVTNLSNGKSVIVRVNDRGPFVADRILDLSYAAARKIGMIRRGVAWVKIEVLEWGQP